MATSLPKATEAVACVGGVATGAVLAAVAALRRGKAVHPHGAVFNARLIVAGASAAPPAGQLLSRPGEHAALVRFSRSLGLPRPLPDLLGMSIRVLDAYGPGAHQDFLLVTSADRPVLYHVFLPAGDVQRRPYTSSLPFRAGPDRFIVGVLPRADSPRPAGGDELDRARAAAATGRLRFDLAVARPGERFTAVAELRIGSPANDGLDAMRFEPWKGGGGLEPAGVLNGMRRYAYPIADAAWRLTRGRASRPPRDRAPTAGRR